jgi:hypothetical protein
MGRTAAHTCKAGWGELSINLSVCLCVCVCVTASSLTHTLVQVQGGERFVICLRLPTCVLYQGQP